jgi:hypothetical protein
MLVINDVRELSNEPADPSYLPSCPGYDSGKDSRFNYSCIIILA